MDQILWGVRGLWDERAHEKGRSAAQRETLKLIPKWWKKLAGRKDNAGLRLKDILTCIVALDPDLKQHLSHARASLVTGGSISDYPAYMKRILAGIAFANDETDDIEVKRFESKPANCIFSS